MTKQLSDGLLSKDQYMWAARPLTKRFPAGRPVSLSETLFPKWSLSLHRDKSFINAVQLCFVVKLLSGV